MIRALSRIASRLSDQIRDREALAIKRRIAAARASHQPVAKVMRELTDLRHRQLAGKTGAAR